MSPRDLVALVLAVAVGAMLVIAVSFASWNNRSLSEGGGEVLIALGGAIVGALAGYIAKGVVDSKDKP